MRILIELPTWMGDTLMAIPAINNILKFHYNSRVTVIGSPISIEILKQHSQIENFIILNKKYFSLLEVSKKIGKFDIFFSLRGAFRSRIFKLLIASDEKYQYNKNKYKKNHQVEKYNHFINDCLKSNLSPGAISFNSNFKPPLRYKRKIIGINPGASYGSAKRWYPEKFAEVAIKLSPHYDILIFGGLDEQDIASDIEQVFLKNGVLNYQNLAGKTSIPDLIDYISNLALFITGDSGPMHIAASLEIPTVSIFGPTNDNETSQWMNNKNIIIKKSLDCQPCMKRTCPLVHHNCMKMINSKDVLDAIEIIN